MEKKYVIGCDFGTLSMRAVLVDAVDGRTLAEDTYTYSGGVITDHLPDSDIILEGPDWALQNPDDYLSALVQCIPAVVRKGGIDPEQVVGIGVDFTTCTVVPMDKNGDALCKNPTFRDHPHAWVKLWKNHTAQKEADDITDYVKSNKLSVLDGNGLRASSEYFFPKVLEIFRKDREAYEAAHTYMEGGDFVVSKLCGKPVRGGVTAGAKGFHDNETMSYPDKAFFGGLEPGFENVVADKHLTGVLPVGSPAGNLEPEMARLLGLTTDTVVCVAHADAAVALPGCGVVTPNIMTFIMGTSTCHIMMSKEKIIIPGISAVFYEGVLPGYYTYETGQSAVGDIFEWFCKHYLPAGYADEAKRRSISPLTLMDEKAAALRVGQSGLVALDWMNGNRCLLQDSDLSGLIVGLTLATKPEEIYRALLESTAFGTKIIIDRFVEYGIAVNEAYACGGLAHKSPVLMQMYADILGFPIKISAYKHTSALASALFAAVAAGVYDDHKTAAANMIPSPAIEYKPNSSNAAKYSELFGLYKQLHDYFGDGGGAIMKKLKSL
ncbi:MAG: ribulokinase [Oscillospiraceae bacterium]|nr:ribulokinase [Oscillospiraceae bacterium]